MANEEPRVTERRTDWFSTRVINHPVRTTLISGSGMIHCPVRTTLGFWEPNDPLLSAAPAIQVHRTLVTFWPHSTGPHSTSTAHVAAHRRWELWCTCQAQSPQLLLW